ncbi:MAG TPA: hypothetical protein VGO55_05070 [Allosphingosinicella sp.]|jgi:hypothetical protein|nr:hypothetical protein [Allosphingosinicella sp.]
MKRTIARRPVIAIVALFASVAAVLLQSPAEARTSARDCSLARSAGRPVPSDCPGPVRRDTNRSQPRRTGQNRPVQPASPPAPRLRPQIVLAPSGGDATTLAQAYRLVEPGGSIHIRSGRYQISRLTINKPVRLIGDGARSARPVLQSAGPALLVDSETTIENLIIQSSQDGPIVQVNPGGAANILASEIRFEETESVLTDGDLTRHLVPAGAPLYLLGGRATVRDSAIGPGRVAGATVEVGDAILTIEASTIRGLLTAVMAHSGANITIRSGSIIRSRVTAISVESANVTLQIDGNTIETPTEHPAIRLIGEAAARITNNRFPNGYRLNWMLINGSEPAGPITGNVDGRGQPLLPPRALRAAPEGE